MPFVVDIQVPCGNACGIDVRPGEVAEVRFTPDPHGGPEVLWFCFCLRSTGTDRVSRVRLILEHAHNMLGGHEPGHMRPVVRYAGQDWQRLGSPRVQELPDGRRRVSWEVDAPLSTMDVAYCYPYGQLDVDTLVRETHGYWKADAIGVSQGARPLVRLSNDYGHARGDRPGLYLIARQHSGETPGSWVLDGFMRRVAELGDRAPLVWAVPLAHIDGVVGGDYGKDGFPYDLNRAWGNPPMRHETLVYQRDVQRWIERCRPVLGIDFQRDERGVRLRPRPGASSRHALVGACLDDRDHERPGRVCRRYIRARGGLPIAMGDAQLFPLSLGASRPVQPGDRNAVRACERDRAHAGTVPGGGRADGGWDCPHPAGEGVPGVSTLREGVWCAHRCQMSPGRMVHQGVECGRRVANR